jgi:hypothetical protein
MRAQICSVALLLLSLFLATCGASNKDCLIQTAINPTSATADHAAAPPENHVQFSLQSSVKGNCPMIADRLGVWSTSDPVNTSIDNQGLAVCLHPTSSPATISNSGTIRGHGFPSATLLCK